MKKHLTIIGGGFSSWVAASIFADNGYSVDVFEKEKDSFGSQQITPNGWEALSNLIELRNIQKYFEPFYSIYIKKLNSNNNLEVLYHQDLVEQNYNYGSIERKSIISFFKKNALKKNTIKIINSNVTNIISSDGVTDFFNPNVIRSSIGHIFNINIFSEKSEKIISNLQRLNYEIISLDPDSAKSIKSYKPKKNYALVIGSEQYGISKIWKDNASQVLKIDTENKVDSLNASGAAAIAMWEFYKINE